MKKILGLSVAALMVMGLVGGGTWAYFSDMETSTGNAFQAGTIDLKVNGSEWSTALDFTDMKPGDTIGSLVFSNTGTLDGDLSFTWGVLTENDHTQDTSDAFEFAASNTTPNLDYELSADQLAKLIYVTVTSDDGVTPETVTDGNGDGKTSLYELISFTTANPIATLPTLTDNETVTFTFTLGDAFAATDGGVVVPAYADWSDYAADYDILTNVAWNVPMADGLTVDITATLKQQD